MTGCMRAMTGWLLRLQTGSDLALERLRARYPVLHVSTPGPMRRGAVADARLDLA